MSPELSRRVGILMSAISDELLPQAYSDFVLRVAKVKDFEELTQEDQTLITNAEAKVAS